MEVKGIEAFKGTNFHVYQITQISSSSSNLIPLKHDFCVCQPRNLVPTKTSTFKVF